MIKKLSLMFMLCLMMTSKRSLAVEALPENLKPHFIQVTREEAEDCAVCEIEKNLKKTHEENEAKAQSFDWQGYSICIGIGFAIGVFISNNHR